MLACDLPQSQVFEPYPSIAPPASAADQSVLLFDPKKPDYDLVKRLLKTYASMESITDSGKSDSYKSDSDCKPAAKRTKLEGDEGIGEGGAVDRAPELHDRNLAKKLLWWVVNSNTAMIQRVEDAIQLKEMSTATSTLFWTISPAFASSVPPHTRRVACSTRCPCSSDADWCVRWWARFMPSGTPYQFHLLTAPPKREAAFSKAKKVHGTVFAFHGSPCAANFDIIVYHFSRISQLNTILAGAA